MAMSALPDSPHKSMAPVRVLCSRRNVCILLREPILAGMLPLMVLSLRSSRFKLTSFPTSSVIVPDSLLDVRLRELIRRSISAESPELHVTPYHDSAHGSW